MKTVSWVIVSLFSGKAVMELYNENLLEKVNKDLFKAVPILDYLTEINRRIKLGDTSGKFFGSMEVRQ